MSEISPFFNFNLTTYEICPIRWFLVKTNLIFNNNNNIVNTSKYRYYILHVSDLIDGNLREINENRLVSFKLNNERITGIVLEASNRMFYLIDRMQQVTYNAEKDIYQSTDDLLQRLNNSLREINGMAASLKRIANLTPHLDQKEYFKRLMEQLTFDGDEISETKAFFNSLNLVCLKCHSLIETNRTKSFKEIQTIFIQYLNDVYSAAGDLKRYQRVFHPPHCICNLYEKPGKLQEIIKKILDAHNEVIDR